MRPKPIILLVLALGCGLAASVSINQVLAKRRAAPQVSLGDTKSILVAMIDIESGEVVQPQLIKLEEWPVDKVPQGAMTDPTLAENRRTKTKLYAGEPLLEFKLLASGQKDGASASIPKGFRVVSVRVDDVSGGSSLIRPDDRVDVLVYLIENPTKGIKETSTRTVLQDIRVFAVNDIYSGRGSEAPDKGISARTISLLVTPDHAEKVTLASQLGEIRLVLRGREDIGEAATTGARAQALLTGTDSGDRDKEKEGDNPLANLLQPQQPAPPPVAVAPPPVVEEVDPSRLFKMVVIEGNTLREITFKDGKLAEGPSPVLPPEDSEDDEPPPTKSNKSVDDEEIEEDETEDEDTIAQPPARIRGR